MSANDEIFPRVPEYRYRLYFRKGNDLGVPIAAPTMTAIGLAILTLHEDQRRHDRRLADLGVLGILDAVDREWIVLPWERPDIPVTFGQKLLRRIRL